MSKSMFIFIAGMIFLSSFTSCEKEEVYEPDITLQYPVAAFSFSGNEARPPVTVQFINKSETIIPDSAKYTWTFGINGPQSEEKNPSFTFTNTSSQTKVYQVSLTVKDLVSNLSQTRSLGVEIQGSSK